MRKRAGDTLIEVMLAVGIFSMIAIAIVAIMNGGSSGAQTSLESTLAREEVDTQAEALRFIQSAYIADMEAGVEDSKYVTLWRAITNPDTIVKADDSENLEDSDSPINQTIAYLSSAPTSCKDLYSNETIQQHAFIINPSKIYDLSKDSTTDVDNILYTFKNNKSVFSPATTYPRLIYNANQLNNKDNLADNSYGDLYRAEGIYVVAVQDANSTSVVGFTDASGNKIDTGVALPQSVFYDFYIRTCWYGVGDDSPSSVATVVRLYDPDALANLAANNVRGFVSVFYKDIDNPFSERVSVDGQTITDFYFGYRAQLYDGRYLKRDNYTFMGWCRGTEENARANINHDGVEDEDTCNGIPLGTGTNTSVKNPNAEENYVEQYYLADMWTHTRYVFEYNTNGGNWDGESVKTVCFIENAGNCQITDKEPKIEGYKFLGWCTQKISTNETCPGTLYKKTNPSLTSFISSLPMPNPVTRTTLYATWAFHPDTVFLLDSTGSMGGMIKQSKDGIKKLAQKTLQLGGKVALFDYRDLKDPYDAAKQRCTFGTCTYDNIIGYVDGIKVGGGGDIPESLLASLMYVMDSLTWTDVDYTKTIVVITDATYLNPDRNGVTYDQVIAKAKQLAPLHIYIVVNGTSLANSYSNMAKDTDGRVVLIGDMVEGLDDIIK